ncbi:MAG: bacteriohemerythrin [Bacillota bacterium]
MNLLENLNLKFRIWFTFIVIIGVGLLAIVYIPAIEQTWLKITLYLISGALILKLGLNLNKSIESSLAEISNFSQELAAGNLSVEQLKVASNGDLGLVKENLNQMAAEMKSMVQEVLAALDKLEAYSKELSASAHQGDSTIQDTTDLIETISASIQQISASTQEVTSLAQESNSKTQAGSQKIDKTLSSMQTINHSVSEAVDLIHDLDQNSQEIGQIIELIDNIAQQTNMLALNAAIEASRASSTTKGSGTRRGEAGAGFSVVAEEIRELAEDTNRATEKISKLIIETQDKADKGLDAVEQVKEQVATEAEFIEETGQIFAEISNASQSTATKVEETSYAAQDLAHNSEEVREATADIDEMSTEIADSSQEVSEVVQELHQVMQQFNFGETKVDSLVWKDKFSIGVDKLDQQHQKLFKQVNNLIAATQNNKGQEEIERVVDFLAQYTVEHFKTEEKIQQEHNYPDYEEHQEIHSNFVEQVSEAQEKIKQGTMKSADLVKMNKMVSRWLVNHVKGIDQELGRYIKTNS